MALPSSGGPVQSLAFNPSGRLFATGDTSRRLWAWHNARPFFQADLRSRADKVRTTERIRSLAFSPHGRYLYVACGDTLRAFDLLTRDERWSFQPGRTFGLILVSPVAVAVSPAGNVLACLDSGVVRTWTDDGRPIAKWCDNDAPRHVAFMPDGLSVVGADGFTVTVWEAYSGRRVRRAHSRERIFGMALDPVSERIAVRTLHTIELLDLAGLAPVARFQAPTGLPLLAFAPDGSGLAVAGREEVILTDARGEPRASLPTDGARVLSLAFHPMGALLTAGCSDGVVRFWDLRPEHR